MVREQDSVMLSLGAPGSYFVCLRLIKNLLQLFIYYFHTTFSAFPGPTLQTTDVLVSLKMLNSALAYKI